MVAKVLEMLFDKKTDSISISKTSTGKISFDVKIYAENLRDDAERDAVLARLKDIYDKLNATFKEGGA